MLPLDFKSSRVEMDCQKEGRVPLGAKRVRYPTVKVHPFASLQPYVCLGMYRHTSFQSQEGYLPSHVVRRDVPALQENESNRLELIRLHQCCRFRIDE